MSGSNYLLTDYEKITPRLASKKYRISSPTVWKLKYKKRQFITRQRPCPGTILQTNVKKRLNFDTNRANRRNILASYRYINQELRTTRKELVKPRLALTQTQVSAIGRPCRTHNTIINKTRNGFA